MAFGGGVHLWLTDKLIYMVERGGRGEGYDPGSLCLLPMRYILAKAA